MGSEQDVSNRDTRMKKKPRCWSNQPCALVIAVCLHILMIPFSVHAFQSIGTSSSFPRIAAPLALKEDELAKKNSGHVLEATPVKDDIQQEEEEETLSAEEQVRAEAVVRQDSAFDLLAGRAALCLLESDIRRDAIGKEAGTQASSATNWINDASAFALQKAFDRLCIKLPDQRMGLDRDESSAWMRWMKTVPTPMIVDFSEPFRELVDATLSDKSYDLIDQSKEAFLNRVGCRMILLPSGTALPRPLSEFPASIIYGKLLYGGVTRSRLLVSSNSRAPPRQAGVRQEVKTRAQDHIPAWMMYGGPDRMYQGVDIGSAAVLEVVLLPRGKSLQGALKGSMVIQGFGWDPHEIFDFVSEDKDNNTKDDEETSESNNLSGYSPASLSGQERNEAFRSNFQSSVGGLQAQIDAIVRRVLDGRIIRPADVDNENDESMEDKTSSELAANALEAEELALIGLTPVRGLLLYGPPGK